MKMSVVVPVQFPPGEILDLDGFVWTTLPPGTGISRSRILGTCSGDPLKLFLAQVTVERGPWRLDLLSADQIAAFPLDRGFQLVLPGLEQCSIAELGVRMWSTAEAPVKVTVHVKRAFGAPRDEHGRLLAIPEPITFRLTLLARGVEESSP
jgi:hypothetical protein